MTHEGRQIIRMLYFPILLTGFIIYALYFDRFREFSEIIRNAAPPIIFLLGGILAYANGVGEARHRRYKGELESTIVLSNYDIYLMQILMIIVPALIIFLPLIGSKSRVDIIDFIQGIISFFPLYWIRMRYFKFTYRRDENKNFVLDDTVVISYYDSMILDGTAFAGASALALLPALFTQNFQLSDFLQSGVFFLVIYWINIKYFKFF